ncbi:hypothetical protein ACLBPJ_29145, partial [Klebsiella pneumoniae]
RICTQANLTIFAERSKVNYVVKQVRYALKQKGVTTVANSSMTRFLYDLFHPKYRDNQIYNFGMTMSDVYVMGVFKNGYREIYGKDVGEIFESHTLDFLEREYMICGQYFPKLYRGMLV